MNFDLRTVTTVHIIKLNVINIGLEFTEMKRIISYKINNFFHNLAPQSQEVGLGGGIAKECYLLLECSQQLAIIHHFNSG